MLLLAGTAPGPPWWPLTVACAWWLERAQCLLIRSWLPAVRFHTPRASAARAIMLAERLAAAQLQLGRALPAQKLMTTIARWVSYRGYVMLIYAASVRDANGAQRWALDGLRAARFRMRAA